MTTTWFYGIARDSDFASNKIKLGITKDPYDRIHGYGTAAMADDEMSYRFLVEVKTADSTLSRKIERSWQGRFPQITSSVSARSLNRASSIEARRFDSIYNVIEGLKSTLNECSALLSRVALSEKEIEDVLRFYQAQSEGTGPVTPNVIASEDSRITRINAFQEPHRQRLHEFLVGPERAAMMEAVCGFGKTVVTSKALRTTINRLVVVVPTDSLKKYWRGDLIKYGGFADTDIIDVGGSGINKSEDLVLALKRDRFVLLLCYASTHLLQDHLSLRIELAIFDEAHRLAGVAAVTKSVEVGAEKDPDIGRTKRLVRKCADVGIKRLSLTFTPKGFVQDDDSDDLVNSNNDIELFGEPIIKVSLREMIEAGLLPSYQIVFPRGETTNGDTLKSKVQLYSNAFQKRENDVYLMNHGIIFAASHKECTQIVEHYKSLDIVDKPVVIHLDSASTLEEKLALFIRSPRAILVNCLLLGEGVNIPIADSVCIMCEKHSYTQIVQMLLRAGRYYPGKSTFYIIMTLLDDDDSESVYSALEALTRIDIYFDEQILRTLTGSPAEGEDHGPNSVIGEKGIDDLILTDSANWNDIPKITECFLTLLRRRTKNGTRFMFQMLREQCKRAGILHVAQYNRIREKIGWIEEPWVARNLTAYDFFHGEGEPRVSQEEFRKVIKDNAIVSTASYISWHTTSGAGYPSVEDVNEGYFNAHATNLQQFLPQLGGRRR